MTNSSARDALITQHLDAILRASGSALHHFSMAKTLEDMRAALLAAAEAIASSAAPVPGLSPAQEPKYTVTGYAIVNRATGESIPADEPVFIFRASDCHAFGIISRYAREVADPEHAAAVWARAADFQRFQDEYPERIKAPDTKVEDALPADFVDQPQGSLP
jgi:hypothetical protein